MSTTWQGKSKGTPLGYRIFVAILRNFGVAPGYFLLRFVAGYYVLFSFKGTAATYHYFHKKLGYGFFKSIRKIYQNNYLFGQSIVDKVVLMSGIPNKFTFNFDGEDNLRKIAALKRGGLLLSAHIGNWEIAGHLLKRIETRINIVMYDGEHEKIKEYMTKVTGQRNVNVIVIKNELSHIYEISDALKNNELVCMHADRFVEGNKTVTAEFLGEKARFPLGPFILAAKFKVPVSFVFAMKEGNLHYHFFSSELKEYGHLGKDIIVDRILNDYVKSMEEKVKEYPEQWYNYYNFWKQ